MNKDPGLTGRPQLNMDPFSAKGRFKTSADVPRQWRPVTDNSVLLLLLYLALFVIRPAVSLADNQLSIQIEHPWLRAVPDSMDMTAAYMILRNTGSVPAELVGGSTSIADSVTPMITTKEGEGLKQMVGMKAVDSLKIPAHGTLVLEPNGNHLMVMGLKEHPKQGTVIDFTIKLEPGDHEIHLQIPVSKTPVK